MKRKWFIGEKKSSVFIDGFIKNVLILATGTAAVQILNFALTPLITRLYSPEAFGAFGLNDSIICIRLSNSNSICKR